MMAADTIAVKGSFPMAIPSVDCLGYVSFAVSARYLGGVDKFGPVSGGGKMDHAEEAFGKWVIAGGDGPVDFEMPEHTLDAITLLVKNPVMLDLHATV